MSEVLPLDGRIIAKEVVRGGLDTAESHVVEPIAQTSNTTLDLGRGQMRKLGASFGVASGNIAHNETLPGRRYKLTSHATVNAWPVSFQCNTFEPHSSTRITFTDAGCTSNF